MAVSDELLKELAVLSQGRNPAWTKQDDYEADPEVSLPPVGGTGGVSVSGSIVTLLQVEPRLNPKFRTIQVEIQNAVSGNKYYCNIIDGVVVESTNLYTAAPSDTVEDIADGLATDINANSAIVDATPDGAVITLIRDDATDYEDYSIDVSGSDVPSDVETIWQDASLLTGDVYVRAENQTAGEEKFELVPGGLTVTVNRQGWSDRLVTAGYDYVFFHPLTSDGNFRVLIGPCVLEE